MKKRLIAPAIILAVTFFISVFSITFTYLVISRLKKTDMYDKELLSGDIELSLVIATSSLVCNLVLVYYLIKKKVVKLKKD